ncbi:DUF4288 domain-containing protein [Priestia aryabhattai]|uniref:DUF4288 domain-containing protein n=1 Tax=Priestia aryabhattai TaxID=412384 RepID=UPI0027E59E9A|nr:DUF4288 domain-containing protein [Priestia aryabhattai]MCG0050782.1 DUF4288 domain-containing protein [Priestia aryabhattai]
MQTHKKEALVWKWYGVKVLYKYLVSGKPTPEKIDTSYNEHQIFEESILLIQAQSFDQAYELAEQEAKEREDSYTNVYDQLIEFKYIESLDAFELFEDGRLASGTEVYSRFVHTSKEEKFNDFLTRYYPEVVESEEEQIKRNFILRNRDFN